MTEEQNSLVEKLKKKLHEGETQFTYRKKNGEERMAVGTLNKEIYGEENAPKGTEAKLADNVIRYFDMNSAGWRSFIAENLIAIEI